MAINFVDLAIKKVKETATSLGKKVNEFSTWYNTPSIPINSTAGKIYQGMEKVSNVVSTPFAKYGQQQIAEPILRGAQTIAQPGVKNKVVGGLQALGGAFSGTPVGVASNLIQTATTLPISAIRNRSLASGVASAEKTLFNPVSFGEEALGMKPGLATFGIDLLTGGGDPRVAMAGVKGLSRVGESMGLFGRAKEIDLNLKEVDALYDAWKSATKAEKPRLLEDIRNAADRNLSPALRDKFVSNPLKLLDEMKKNLTSKRPQLQPTVLGLVDNTQANKGGGQIAGMIDETPTQVVKPKLELLKGETGDMARARLVGYQIDNGRVAIKNTADGWEAKIYDIGGETITKAGYQRKQQLINDVYKTLNPDYGVPISKGGVPEGGVPAINVQNEGWRKLKVKLGEKKATQYFDKVNKLIDPYKGNVVEYRPNGVVTKEGDKFVFNALAGMDTKDWRIAWKSDVTEQFVKSSPQPEGVGVKPSSPTDIRTNLQKDVDQISKPLLEKQLKGEITIPTKATPEVSSPSIIRSKGKLNVSRLKVKGAGKEAIQQIENQVKPTIIGNKEVIETARTATGNKGALTDDAMKKLLAQQLKNRQKVVDLSVRFNQAKQNGASEVELGKIMLDMANQSKVARQGGTFAGRLLQAQNIIADQSATPTQKILALLDNAGVAPEKYLKDSVKVNWDNPTEVVNFYRKYVPPKFGEWVDEVRYSNMLSSPLTHIINTASNALQTGIVAPVEKTISGVLDWGKSALTGSERQYYARSGVDYAGGYVKALPQAFKKAWKVLSGSEVLVKPDYERIPIGSATLGGKVLKAYSTPLRALEAMDQFFKTLVEGGVASELKKGPQKLLLSQVADKATKEANYRLFRQAFDPTGELGQGPVLQLFDKWNSAIANVRRLPGGKWVMPFLQTPTNILKQGIEYSPLGVTTAFRAKAPIEQLSKTLIGTSVFLGAYQLAKNGLVSWESPSSETERELYYEAGMQPYSVKIGNNWVSFSKLGPLAYPMAMAAALNDAQKMNPDKSTAENIGKGIGGILGFFGDQSYVRSIGDLVDAIKGEKNISSNAMNAEAANLVGQIVPYKSFLTWLGRTIDPVYRKASSFGERMVKDMPIIGSGLEPYTNTQGEPSKRDYPVLNAFSPYKVTQEKQPAAQMLEDYSRAKVKRAIEKREDEKFLAGDEKAQTLKGVYRYIDKEGSLKKIDTSEVVSMPETSSYEKLLKEKAAYALADDILNLKVEEQAKAFSEIGISPDDATYYQVAKADNRLKTAYINDAISQIDTKDRGDLINYLVSQRKEVNGDMVLANGVVDDLFDAGIISESEKKMLKNLTITGGKVKTKLTGRGKKTTLKKVSLSKAATKLSAPKIKNMKQLLASAKIRSKKYKFRRTL